MPITRWAVSPRNQVLASLVTASTNTVALVSVIYVYTGAPPASPESAATGTLLVNAVNPVPAMSFTQSSNGTITLANAPTILPSATGIAGWARIRNVNGIDAMDVDLTLAGGGGGMTLATLSLTSGVAVGITNFSIQVPAELGTVKLSTSLRNKMATQQAVAANIGIGSSGFINVYSGAAPATADLAPTGTLLASFPTGTAGWVTPSGASAALTASLVVAAVATGTAGYVRLVKNADVLQGSVGTTGTDFILDSLALTSGANTTLTGATLAI